MNYEELERLTDSKPCPTCGHVFFAGPYGGWACPKCVRCSPLEKIARQEIYEFLFRDIAGATIH